MNLHQLAAFLDSTLNLPAFPADDSNNGLQIENNGHVAKICTGVDASLPFLEEAAARGADLAITHHGLSWRDSLKHITGLNYRLLKSALLRNIALYSAHLPLDAHPALGNNARLAALLGLQGITPFYRYHGMTIGFKGTLPEPLPLENLVALLCEKVNPGLRVHPFGRREIRTIGIVSGGASTGVAEAAAENLDLYLTGEPSLQGYNLAQQLGVTTLFAGHYATERFGVRALGDHIAATFAIPVEHIDFEIPY